MIPHFGKLIYLASPLTHDDPAVREERSNAVAHACGWLIANHTDLFFFSPIAHAEKIASAYSLPFEWEFWEANDKAMLSRAEEIWVLCLPGFRTSTGVNAERRIAAEFGLPCRFVIPTIGAYVVTDTEP